MPSLRFISRDLNSGAGFSRCEAWKDIKEAPQPGPGALNLQVTQARVKIRQDPMDRLAKRLTTCVPVGVWIDIYMKVKRYMSQSRRIVCLYHRQQYCTMEAVDVDYTPEFWDAQGYAPP